MKDLTDVLERVEKILYELRVRPENAIIIVEGRKDVEALHSLDIGGDILKIQDSRKSVFAAVEDLAARGKEVYILTEIKDVESLPSYIALLKSRIYGQ